MAMHIGAGQVKKLLEGAKRFKDRMAKAREQGEAMIMEVVATVEIGATSFLIGLARGHWGEIDVVGVPADLLAAILLKLGAFGAQAAGWTHSGHVHNFGNAFLASYLTVLGVGIGAKGAKGASAGAGAGELTKLLTDGG